MISKFVSGAIIIVKAGSTNVIALKKRLKEFPNLQQKILGLILNQSILDSAMKKYKYYSYLY
jgi:Mrp family chromosome partitioning ATPase